MSNAVTHILNFRDERPPHVVKFSLERELRSLFKMTMNQEKLCMSTNATIVDAAYAFLLRFEAALQTCNCYSLAMDVSWPASSSSNADYHRTTSASWFNLWTREFIASGPPLTGEGSIQRYRQLCEEAISVEQELDSIDAIQRAIIEAMKQGATFRTSHKEGGTRIYWKSGHFVRTDYGEYPNEKQFNVESEFLNMLFQFSSGDINQFCGREQRPVIDTWLLIKRRMELP